jgi:hypothetical protein
MPPKSGSGEVLLLPLPLRAARDSCPSCSSSLHERPSREAAALAARDEEARRLIRRIAGAAQGRRACAGRDLMGLMRPAGMRARLPLPMLLKQNKRETRYQ